MSIGRISDYPKLVDVLKSNTRIVYLFGAGASMSLGEHNLSWKNWILKGKDFLSPLEKSQLDALLNDNSLDSLMSAVSYLLERLKENDAYDDFMKETMNSNHPVNNTFIDGIRGIWHSNDLITTTNYDLLIEESLSTKGITYNSPAEILSIVKNESDNKVIHLHGMYDSLGGIDDIIANNNQYNEIIANDGAQFIQKLIGTNPIIVVGCGGTMEDPNLSCFMSFLIEKLKVKDIPYFYLMKNGDNVPELPNNAIPIYYGDDYSDLPIFLNEISLYRLKCRSGLERFVSINPYIENKTSTSSFGRMYFANGFNAFVGREKEKEELNSFIQSNDKFSYISVIGEGGIGKSRLVLEWMRTMNPHWFGFFIKKDPNLVNDFIPFTDSVIAFDYVLGQEEACVNTISILLDKFSNSPFKLRIIFLERNIKATDDGWLYKIKNGFSSEQRLQFENAYPILKLENIDDDDEKEYISNYLKSYLSVIEPNDFITNCINDVASTSLKIYLDYHKNINKECLRPLYLSIYIEVWINKNGLVESSSPEELLHEYLIKEKKRWKSILKKDYLVDSYLRILAVACVTGVFNITDVNGNNYLENDCNKIIDFLDNISNKPGSDSTFEDLFITCSELVFSDNEDSNDFEGEKIIEILTSKSKDNGDKYNNDELLAFYAPLIKIDADPDEVYLQLLVDGGIASKKDKQKLLTMRKERKIKEQNLPNHAWIINPIFPDIIKEYIVKYSVSDYDIVNFTKLVKSNSILVLPQFFATALDDWPNSNLFQKMIIIPPNEVLNYSEYYFSILTNMRSINDLTSIEKSILKTDHIFVYYELEIWRRISIVLFECNNQSLLVDSAYNFIDYLKQISDIIRDPKRISDVIDSYCVGLHNSLAIKELSSFLNECLSLKSLYGYRDIKVLLCRNFARLIKLKLYKNINADIFDEWSTLINILNASKHDKEICQIIASAADDYYSNILQRRDYKRQIKLERDMSKIYDDHRICEAAEINSLCIANLMIKHRIKGDYLKLYKRIEDYLKEFPDSLKLKKAFLYTSDLIYNKNATTVLVPKEILNIANKLSLEHQDEIEIQEAYFGLLCSKLFYEHAHHFKKQMKETFKDMERVARHANYHEYNEDNRMLKSLNKLKQLL